MTLSKNIINDSYDLDISLVSKVNKMADTRLQRYLNGLQEKYDAILYKMTKQIIETRRELDLMQTEKDKIAMRMMKKYAYANRKTVQSENVPGLNRNLATSTTTLTSVPTASASNYESASESLPFSNASASNFETTLGPVFENAPYGTIVRPHTLGNPFKFSSQSRSKKGRGRKKQDRLFPQLNERNLSRMDESLAVNHNFGSEFYGESSSKPDLTLVSKIWEKNRCLTRGHFPKSELRVESVYKTGELDRGLIPKRKQIVGYEILTTSRPVRLQPLSPKQRLKSGSHLSVMTVC